MKTKIVLLTLALAVTVQAQTRDGFSITNTVGANDYLPVMQDNGRGGVVTRLVSPARLVNAGMAVCYPDGTYKINGQLFAPKDTKTCGIQEAINALPDGSGQGQTGGGVIRLAPGIFKTSETIYGMPEWQSNSFSLKVTGAGMASSGILMTNLIPHEVFNFSPGAVGHSNSVDFYMNNLFLSSITNAVTNILTLSGHANPDFTLAGGIGNGKIEYCLFGWWNGLTNRLGNISPDAWSVDLGALNLVGLNLVNNYGGDFTVDHDTFVCCIPAIMDNDNSLFTHNQIISCSPLHQNAWPSSSPIYKGYEVNFISTSAMVNSIHVQDIGFNHFVGNSHKGYLFIQNKNPSIIHDDYFEGSTSRQIATANRNVIAINFTADNGLNFDDITNTVDWSKPFQVDTGLVQTVSWKNLADANFKFKTNAAPTSVTIGTTAPDRWIKQTNANDGVVMFIPTWINH